MRFINFMYLIVVPLSLSAQEYPGAVNYAYGTYNTPAMPDLTLHTLSTGYQGRGWEFGAGIKNGGVMYAAEQNSLTGLPDRFVSIEAAVTRSIRIKKNLSLKLSLRPQVNWANGHPLHGYNFIPGGEALFRVRLTEKDSTGIFLGAGYSTTLGRPRFLPLAGYEWKTERFRLVAGFPEFQASYSLKRRHTFSAWARPTSMYAQVPDEQYVAPTDAAGGKLSFEWVNICAGLSYAYLSGEGWATNFSLGKSLYQSAEIFGEKYTPSASGLQQSLSVSAGFTYKLNF